MCDKCKEQPGYRQCIEAIVAHWREFLAHRAICRKTTPYQECFVRKYFPDSKILYPGTIMGEERLGFECGLASCGLPDHTLRFFGAYYGNGNFVCSSIYLRNNGCHASNNEVFHNERYLILRDLGSTIAELLEFDDIEAEQAWCHRIRPDFFDDEKDKYFLLRGEVEGKSGMRSQDMS